MADENTKPSVRAATTSNSSRNPAPPASAALRQRFPQRHSSEQGSSQSPKPKLDRRRSSLLSYSSFEDLTTTLTDDLINPSLSRPRTAREADEVTHWHSTPLAFAILPALGGLMFKNGSAFVTDILLLVLAAIFMNWSIRLPWDWYYSAQAQRRVAQPDYADELDTDETAVESVSSAGNSPKRSPELEDVSSSDPIPQSVLKREVAAAELRQQEKLALLATFVFPALAAYLLHVIRAQLSRSSTGLVSDYNITIFVLAAEIRPFRQLIRLVTNRTMHLQRTVTGLSDPFGPEVEKKDVMNDLTTRVADLETKLADHTTAVPQNGSIAQKTDVSELSAEVRKRYEPRLDGLERAVRRYEKRQTTLTMLTDQRLASLEIRLQDALSLAAVAAQQSQHRGGFRNLLDNVAAMIMWPLRLAYKIAMSPLHLIDEVYIKLKSMLVGTPSQRTSKGVNGRQRLMRDEKALKDKAPVRKPNR